VDQYDSDDEYRSRPGAPVDIGRLVLAVKRQWKYVPIAVGIGALIGMGFAFLAVKPEYSASATILWEPPDDAEPSDRSFLTQVDSIKLQVNLQEVRRRLKLQMPLDRLKDKINLLFDNSSHLVQVQVTDPNGKNAATLANTAVDVFLEYQRRVGRARGEEHLQAIEADIEVAQAQLKNARDAYDAFRKQMGVSDFALETKLAIEKAATLKQQADLSVAEALTEEARQRQLAQEVKGQSATMSGGASLTNPDAVLLAQVKTQLAQARTHLAPDHPQIQQLEAQVATLSERAKSGAATMVQGSATVLPNQEYLSLKAGISQSKVSKEAAIERQETYKRFAQEAEKRLQQLSEAEGQANTLLSRINLLETRVTELEAQRVRVRDGVRNAAADFRVVTPATVPEKPNPSQRRTIAIKFPLGALAIALLAIFGYELRSLRVYTAREAGFWANTAVVASSTWPREKNTLGALVDELSDAAPEVRGMTLVVGARVNEVPLAREIAYWLSNLTGWTQRGAATAAADEALVDAPKDPAAPDFDPAAASAQPRASSPEQSVALARRASTDSQLAVAQAWDGPPEGPSLRRAARLADRVVVVMASGSLSVFEVMQLRSRLGRNNGIGLLLVGLNPELVKLPDRVGEVDRFWSERPA
jgi:uncharacterized protein involved in exopolysaccharide biosynthesis